MCVRNYTTEKLRIESSVTLNGKKDSDAALLSPNHRRYYSNVCNKLTVNAYLISKKKSCLYALIKDLYAC